MGRVLAVGPAVQMDGWALAGVDVGVAQDAEQAVAVLRAAPSDLALVIVAASLEHPVADYLSPGVLLAVLPE